MSSEKPLHQLMTKHFIFLEDMEFDGVGDLRMRFTPLVGGQFFRIELSRYGHVCHAEWNVKADALEGTIKGFRKMVWWRNQLVKPEEREREEELCRRLRELLEVEPPTCYVCHEVADWQTPCDHAICTKCQLKSIFKCGAFWCGVCRRRHIDNGDGWEEDDEN